MICAGQRIQRIVIDDLTGRVDYADTQTFKVISINSAYVDVPILKLVYDTFIQNLKLCVQFPSLEILLPFILKKQDTGYQQYRVSE